MAEDKKSFILYADLVHTVEQMPKADAGELFLHILKYVNDQNPTSDNLIVKLTFEPIKQQLKRDLKVWEQARVDKSDAGLLGNLKRWHNDLYLQVVDNQLTLSQASEIIAQRQGATKSIANIAVTVNDNVTVNVIDVEEAKKEIPATSLSSLISSNKLKIDQAKGVNNEFLSITECRKLYDSNYQAQKQGICGRENPRWTFEQLKFFQDEFDLQVSTKSTHKVISDYAGHFSNWTAKLSKEQKQAILDKNNPNNKKHEYAHFGF